MESTDRSGPVAGSSTGRRYGLPFLPSSMIQAPLVALLEYSGILRVRPGSGGQQESAESRSSSGSPNRIGVDSSNPQVSIRIVGNGEQEPILRSNSRDRVAVDSAEASRQAGEVNEEGGEVNSPVGSSGSSSEGEGAEGGGSGGSRTANTSAGDQRAYQRYDIHHVARWVEQILPFSLLLLVVFIRQHLQGFFVTMWIAAIMFKSNDILKKQTALKAERKLWVLTGITSLFTVHVFGIYWWYRKDDLIKPLVMLPPEQIPPFWHAIFIIMVNDTMVRQAAMAIKCILLIYYRNSRGRDYRRQGQMLTLVEHLLLLYRALLPTPIWYRFFLNKEYGSLFSSLTTGLYLTFKLTSVVEKVQSFLSALKALSRKDVHYGSYATAEQVSAAGDMCAICQEKMHVPVLLRCKHIFCEDCVSEWFERERTCPLCRALVKPADIRSFGDGSTSLFFQLF